MRADGPRAVGGLALLGTVLVGATFHRLPPRMATHFGAAGASNGWSSPAGYVFHLVMIGLLLPLGMVGTVTWLGQARPDSLNIPTRHYGSSPPTGPGPSGWFGGTCGGSHVSRPAWRS